MIITEELKTKWRQLKPGWDSYNGQPPTELAIKNAEDWVNVTKCVLESYRIVADPVGGILITYSNKDSGQKVYIDFLNDGRDCLLFSDRHRMWSETYKYATIEEIKEFIENDVIPEKK